MTPSVSIIIPGYKADKYVKTCIDSVLAQDYDNLQIILVDDGSPDNCPQIFDQYGADYKNIDVYHQENMGLWGARNTGIIHSTGDYIFFLDSDDELDGCEAISNLVKAAEKNCADITVGNYRKMSGNEIGGVIEHGLKDTDNFDTAQFRFKGFYRTGHLSYNWGKLYRKDFLIRNDLMLKPFPYTQDKYHNMACCVNKPKYAFIEESIYLYRINDESITFKYKKDYYKVWTSIALELKNYIESRKITEDYSDFYAFHFFWGALFITKQELENKHTTKDIIEILEKYFENDFVLDMVSRMAKGKYVDAIYSALLRFAVRFFSFLLAKKMYGLFIDLTKLYYHL